MKLNPQQAPLYGECVLTVQLDDAEACCTEEEEAAEQVEFYLLFSGSNQRHLTTTLRLSQVTLQAVCPAHDVCEQVLVTLCSARPTGQVDPHSQERFYYVQDLALDMAHFLLNNAASEGALLLDEQQVPLKECEKLDHSLALALKHLTWRHRREDDASLGGTHNKDTEDSTHNEGTRLKTHLDASPLCEQQPGTRVDMPGADAREEEEEDDTPRLAVADGHGDTAETPEDVWTDASADLENGIELSQCQQQQQQQQSSSTSSLLHFAASRGLRKVAQFLLQEPGGAQALRRADARGETPARLAQRRGHTQLSELFTQFETLSPNPRVEPTDRPHVHPGGRALLRHHPDLGTYTLTLPAHRGREGGGEEEEEEEAEERERERTANGTRRLLQEEVEELRGLIQRHREQAANEGHRDVGTPTAAFPRLSSSNQEPGGPVSRTRSCSNGQPEDNKAERRGSEVTDKQGSPPPVEEIKDGAAVASAPAISGTSSCAAGSRRHHRHDKNTEQEAAASASALHTSARGRKHRKRTTKKHAGAKNNGANGHSAKETSEARSPAENTGSNAGIVGTPLPTEPLASVAVVGCEQEEVEEESIRRTAGGRGGPGEEGTPILLQALSGLCSSSSGEGKWDSWRPVVVDTTSTAAVEKQEGASLKLGLGASEGEAAERLTETNNKADFRPGGGEGRTDTGARQGPASGQPATQSRAMGQAQSQDSQSDQGEQTTQPDAGNQSPQLGSSRKSLGTEGKPRRQLWRDGDSAIAPDWREKEAARTSVSQSVWYDGGGNGGDDDYSENVDLHRERRTSEEQSSTLLDADAQQPFQHGLSSAVSQPRAAGTQPEPSHGPGAQRQEVHRTQQREEERVEEEEEEEEEGGGEGGGGEGPGREVEGSRQALDKDSSGRRGESRAEAEERGGEEEEIGDEKGGSEERAEEKEGGRRKRRRKRGKKGAREAKLSSSSSVESQSQIDAAQSHAETERERQGAEEGGGGPRPGSVRQAEEVRATDTEAKTGSAESQAPSSTESVLRREADACGMHLPSQTEEGRDSPGLAARSSSLSIADPAGAAPAAGRTGNGGTESTESTVVAGASRSEELPRHGAAEPMEWKENVKPVELGTLSGDAESIRLAESKDFTVADEKVMPMEATGRQEELPLKHFGHGERTEGRNLTEPPELSKLSLELVDSTEPNATSAGTLGSVLETVDYGERPECSTTGAASPVSPARLVECAGSSALRTGAAGCEEQRVEAAADGLLFGGTTDASPMFQKQEGSGEVGGREYPEHCSLSAEGSASEGEKKADRESEGEMIREGTGQGEQSEERVGEEHKGTEEDEGEELLVVDTEERETGRGEEMGEEELNFAEAQEERRYVEELAAASVAVVTVAIASAMANIELANLFAGGRSDNSPDAAIAQEVTERASVPPLVTGPQVPVETKVRFTNDTSHAGLMYPDAGRVVESDLAVLSKEETGKEETATLARHSDAVTLLSHSDTPDTKDNALPSQKESRLLTHESDSPTPAGFTEQAGAESSTKSYIVLLPDTEAISPATLPKDQQPPACSNSEAGREAGTSAQATVTPLRNEAVTAEPGGQEDDSPRPCPVVDTGQDPPTTNWTTGEPDADALASGNEMETEGRGERMAQDGLGSTLEEDHGQMRSEVEGDLCTSVSNITTESEPGHRAHGAEHVSDVHSSVCGGGEAMDAEEQAVAFVGHESEECKGDARPPPPHRQSQSDFGDFAHGNDVEPSQTLAGTGLVVSDPVEVGSGGGGGTLWCQGHQAGAVDSTDDIMMSQGLQTHSLALDAVDGWKERERARVQEEEEEEGSQSSQEDPDRSTAAVRPCPPQQTQSLPEIQREKESFYQLESNCPEPCATTLTATSLPCTESADIHSSVQPHREDQDRVSVSSLQTDREVPEAQRATVTAELDDNVFKKPYPVLDHRERGVRVSWSSTDDAPAQSASMADPAGTPWRSSGGEPWKSETDEAGGGGEDEERKDQLSENPVSSAILRASIRSLSPIRRHSWEPGRNNNGTGEMDASHRSSLRSLPVEVKRTKPPLHRRSMSWCPSNLPHAAQEPIDNRSYSLEGLEVEREAGQTSCPILGACEDRSIMVGRGVRLDSQERGGGSLVSLTEEEQEGDASSIDSQKCHHRGLSMTSSCPAVPHHQPLTKSISMVTISQREIEAMGRHRSKRRISFALSFSPLLKSRSFFSIGSSSSDEEELGGRAGSFSSTTGSLEYSISEEEPGPLRSDSDVRVGVGGTKVSRTFSYLRSKMSKKNKEKDKERRGEKEREVKEKEKKPVNGHVFSPVSPPPPSTSCQQCAKPLNAKEAFFCNNCGAHVHKSCRESLSACAKSRMKQQSLVPEAAPGSAVNMRSKSTSSASSASSTSSCRDQRWSTLPSPDHDQLPSGSSSVVFPRRNHPSILSFNTHSNLSKSISTSNIAGLDEVPLKGLKFLSQSTESLLKGSKVNASTESLTDEGTEMDNQLMGEFECELKDLEADSWSATVDKKFLKLHKKDEVKRQDVIYELYQTEFHHVRTLRIMADVYYKGIQKELQMDSHNLDKVFPMLEELSDLHTHFLTQLLERKRASQAEGRGDQSFLIRGIGDVLVNQFSGCNAEHMKKVYGKFCSRHNEAVHLYKELLAKDKRFQAFIKRIMSSSIVRRLSIPECILLVTQRITKYPVLIQRILQHTKDTDEDYSSISDALRFVKEIIAAVDSKVNDQEKKRRLREVYSRTDSKSIMCMKSGQMFAKEDLIRGRRLMHDGALQLKNSTGRLKDVQAMLLSDVLVFLQEKDQKYIFASLDQRSTVISLQKLIVREVANEERGLFLITAGTTPEMVEVLASSKDERNTWMTIIQDAMHCMEKEEDEGVPSETEEDRRLQENRAKEIRALLRRKDDQIVSLLEEKVHIFRDLCDCSSSPEDTRLAIRERMFFRATPDDVTKGEPIMRDALREVETLHALVNTGLGGAGCSTPVILTGGGVGPVCLPRRAETFGGFDSHQMNCSKNGDKEEGDDSLDLRRTESDSVLKKGATTSLQMLLKRSNEQVNQSVTHLHDLLTSLQAVVVQQDSFIEDQRQALSERLATASSSRHSSSSSLSSCSSSRPPSLIEQEKQRSLERQRQEAASLQKQQAAHQEERRRREKEWEVRDRTLVEREDRLTEEEREAARRRREVEEDGEELQRRKDDLHRDLERLRESQRRLERDKEALRRETERMEAMRREESGKLQRYQRTPSTTSEDSLRFHSSGSLDLEPRETPSEPVAEVELLSSSAPTKEPFLRIGSKRLSKNFFSSSSSKPQQGGEKESQLPARLLQLTKPKDKKDKKKKKGKGGDTEGKATVMAEPQSDSDIFC